MLEKLPDALGHALRNQRAGLDKIAFNAVPMRAGTAAIDVHSLAFIDHGPIPTRYTADGEGVSPPLHWLGVPAAASTVVLIVEDADAPTPQPLVHAIVVQLTPQDTAIAEAALPSSDNQGAGLKLGKNSLLQAAWLPPDPPPGHGVHRYAFQVFALAEAPCWSDTPGRDELLAALHDQGIASGLLIGTYERHDTSVTQDQTEPAAVTPVAVA